MTLSAPAARLARTPDKRKNSRRFGIHLENLGLIVLGLMSRSLLNIAKRSLLRLMLSCVGLASKHAAG